MGRVNAAAVLAKAGAIRGDLGRIRSGLERLEERTRAEAELARRVRELDEAKAAVKTAERRVLAARLDAERAARNGGRR